jgi:cytidylate kinase
MSAEAARGNPAGGGLIAIDGPVASGKSAVGSAIARALGFRFIDTGAMYRALTWLALRRGIDASDGAALAALAASVTLDAGPLPPQGDVAATTIDGVDATPYLRSAPVEQHVSFVSAVQGVRDHLVRRQRELADACAVVVGRDIGTVVLPNADLKVYLDASPETRARRRADQLREQGKPADYGALVTDLRRRDELDSKRAASPLRIASDAVRLVTDDLTLPQTIDRVLALWSARVSSGR